MSTEFSTPTRSLKPNSSSSHSIQYTPKDRLRVDKAKTLKKCLEQSGMSISDLSYSLDCDLLTFHKQFYKEISSIELSSFFNEISYHFEDNERFYSALEPLVFSGNGECTLNNMGLPTFIRTLLEVRCLQSFLINFVLSKLEAVVTSNNLDNLATINDLPMLIINQLRWLNNIERPREFSNKLVQVISVCPCEIKRLIILCLPDVLPDSEHTHFTEKLKDFIFNTDITAVVIDTVGNLTIKPILLSEFRESAISMLDSVPIKDLPYLLKFVLQPTHQEESDALVSQIQNSKLFTEDQEVDNENSNASPNEEKSKVIISTLDSILRFEPYVTESWIRHIQSEPTGSYIDIVVLCILYEMGWNLSKVEHAFKTNLRLNILNYEITANSIVSITQCFELFSNSFLSLVEIALCSNDENSSRFGVSLLSKVYMKTNDNKRQQVINFILQNLSSDYSSEATNPFMAFFHVLIKENKSLISTYLSEFKVLYTILPSFSKCNMISFHEVLSHLMMDVDDRSSVYTLTDNFYTTMNRYLLSTEQKNKNCGILGITVGIRILLVQYGTHSINEARLSSLKKPILSLKSVLSTCYFSMNLFYSEMASTLNSVPRNKEFLRWLTKGLDGEFRSKYMNSLGDELARLGEIQPHIILNLDSSNEAKFSVNILPLIFSLYNKKTSKSTIQSDVDPFSCIPQLRLLSTCIHNLNANFSTLEDIILSPLVLISLEDISHPDNLSESDSHVIALSVLLAFTWLCEVINIHCNAKTPSNISLAYKRLSQLILVQRLVPKWIPSLVSIPRPVYLSITLSLIKQQIDTVQLKSKVKSSKSDKTILEHDFSPFYDQLILETLFLLHIDHTLVSEVSKLSVEEFWNRLPFSQEECSFLVSALLYKLDHIQPVKTFGLPTVQNTSRPLSSEALELLDAFCSIASDLCIFLQLVIRDDNGSSNSEDSMDASLSASIMSQLQINFYMNILACFEIALHIMKQKGDNERIEKVAAGVVAIYRADANISILNLEQLLLQVIEFFDKWLTHVEHFALLHPLCKIFHYISTLCQTSTLGLAISKSVGKILKRSWAQIGANKNQILEELLKMYIQNSQSPLILIEEIAGTAVPQILTGISNTSQLYPTLTTTSMHIFYKAMLAELVNDFKSLQVPPFRTTDPTNLHLERLYKLEISTRLFAILINIVKSFDGKIFVAAALKFGRLYLDNFLKIAMPILDYLFRDKNEEVTSLLKALQGGTRSLQHYCTHSKSLKDITLTRYVPLLRKSLEAFVFRVKAMLALNNCPNAFWIGNLKNKTIQGDVIASQSDMDETLMSIHTDNTANTNGDDYV